MLFPSAPKTYTGLQKDLGRTYKIQELLLWPHLGDQVEHPLASLLPPLWPVWALHPGNQDQFSCLLLKSLCCLLNLICFFSECPAFQCSHLLP